MENYEMNYDPNDIATNAPDFEEPHVENKHVAHFNGDPMQDEAYRRYYAASDVYKRQQQGLHFKKTL